MANYLYNGIELPARPNYDSAIYLYSYIGYKYTTNLGVSDSSEAYTRSNYQLLIRSAEITVEVLNANSDIYRLDGVAIVSRYLLNPPIAYELVDGIWVESVAKNMVVEWTNYDVYYNTNEDNGDLSGTLYLAASEPVPVVEHVVESKGDGYALYNGVKLPNIDTVWTEEVKQTHPYAFISHWKGIDGTETVDEVRLYLSDAAAYNMMDVVYAIPARSKVKEYSLIDDVFVLQNESESTEIFTPLYAAPNEAGEIAIIWASADIKGNPEESNETVYFAASDPIPLDGMNVIEWDGVTDGLENIAEVYYLLADYHNAQNAVAVARYPDGYTFTVDTFAIIADEGVEGWELLVYGATAILANGTVWEGINPGIWCASLDDGTDNTCSIVLAYTPVTTEKKEYVIIYQTQYGVEPESKTVTVSGNDGYVLTEEDLPELHQNGYWFRGWTYFGVPVNINRLIYPEGDTIVLSASWEFMVPMIDRTSLVLGYIYGLGLVAIDEEDNSELVYFNDLWAEFDPATASATVADGEATFASSILETYSFGELSGRYTNGHLYLETTEEVLE